MNRLADNIALLITRELRTYKEELNKFPDEELIWKVIPGINNSAGNLVLHICGNLKHYVGKVLGNSDYVRDRDSEFNKKNMNRNELIAEIDSAIDIVKNILPAVEVPDGESLFPEKIRDFEVPTDRFLMQLSIHAAFHLGQLGYLRRALTGDSSSTSPIAMINLKA